MRLACGVAILSLSLLALVATSESLCGQPAFRPLSTKPEVTKRPKPQTSRAQPRIIGGIKVPARSIPWIALFAKVNKENEEERCGATIISEKWLLTAAHCTDDFHYGKVLLGVTDVAHRYERETYTVIESHIHPEYSPVTFENDIALLKLGIKIHFNDHVQPICLTADDQNMTKSGQQAYVAGWGVHSMPENMIPFDDKNADLAERRPEFDVQESKNGKDDEQEIHVVVKSLSKYLLEAEIPLIDIGTCREKWLKEVHDDSTQLCAGAFQKGTGRGDSGGPLHVRGENGRWYQIGITSFGDNSADDVILDQATNPGVYTRVAHYCKFISETTKGEVTCAHREPSQASISRSSVLCLVLLLVAYFT